MKGFKFQSFWCFFIFLASICRYLFTWNSFLLRAHEWKVSIQQQSRN